MSGENPSVTAVAPIPAATPPVVRQNPALAVAPRELDPDERMAWYMMQSGCCDARSLAQAVVKIRFGQTMGLDPYTSVSGFYVNQKSGKLCPTANLTAALIRSSKRYDYKIVEMTRTMCRLRFLRLVGGQWEVQTPDEVADIKDFKHLIKAGNPWDQYPKNMLFARAIMNGARFHCPDVSQGAPLYTPDELPGGVEVDGETLEVRATVIDAPPASDPEHDQAVQEVRAALQEAGKDPGWLGKALSLPPGGDLRPEDLTLAQLRRALQLLGSLRQEG